MQTCERATLARRSRGAGMRAVTERLEAMLAFLERGDGYLQVETRGLLKLAPMLEDALTHSRRRMNRGVTLQTKDICTFGWRREPRCVRVTSDRMPRVRSYRNGHLGFSAITERFQALNF
jgi:hypothetical protein